MEELRHQKRNAPRERLCAPVPFGGGRTEDATADDAPVLLVWGANTDELDLGGMTVDEIRAQVAEAYHIAPDAEVTVNGVVSTGDTLVRAGDNLEFVHASGEKGAGCGVGSGIGTGAIRWL